MDVFSVNLGNPSTTYATTLANSASKISISGSGTSLFYGLISSGVGNWIQSQHTTAGVQYLALNPAGGNVGVGTTGPAYKLDVAGNTRIGTDALLVGNTNEIWTQSGTNADATFYINHRGYADGLTQFRNVNIRNGKGGEIAYFKGSNSFVGIGTINPLAKLHVNNGSILVDGTTGAIPTTGAGTRMMWIPSKGAFRAGAVTGTQWDVIGTNSTALGYGTIATGDYSTSLGVSSTASGQGSMAFGNSNTSSGNWATASGYNTVAQAYSSFVIGLWNLNPGTYNTTSVVSTDPVFVIGNGTSPTTRSNSITVLKDGKMLIGNPNLSGFMGTPNGYLLFVQQGILAEKVKVAVCTTANWADYVFDKNYKLRDLKELEAYIQTNKHLPNIPSAEEVVKNGIDLAEMNAKLLEKVEELSLYIIKQNKEIEQINNRLQSLEK